MSWVPSALLALLRLDDRRPFRLDLALAATVLFAWFLLNCFQPQLASSRQQLDLAIVELRWTPRWPLGPWLLAVAGLLLVYLRQRHSQSSEKALWRRFQGLTAFALALLAARLAAGWHPVLQLFPYLIVLWTPHTLWALGLLYLLFPHLGVDSVLPWRLRTRWIALFLFLIGLAGYSLYALYFCQVTMLHGDESHYLLVTHSLFRDGDMDLANNLETADFEEFHVLTFEPHRAPASPPGRIYSQHPIGLSVVLLPAYWAGLKVWNNPRLSTALFMVLLAAACLPLAFVYLIRLGSSRLVALFAVAAMAVTPPFSLFSNQLYPEVPALLIALCFLVLLAHWQVPSGRYHSLGQAEPFLLSLLGLLLACLPFLHPRYAPLAVLGGGLVLLQAWHSPQRRISLALLGLIGILALIAQLAFNYTFSGDWMGPFRPGNAWGRDALSPRTWILSLPGQWLQADKGLLNSAPLYLFSLLGWSIAAHQRDRRALVMALFYLATAAVNGLHPDWKFGFCYPARFMVTSLPALLGGLALALPVLARSRAAFFLAALALAVGAEETILTATLPEYGFEGANLVNRTFSDYYPLDLHFVPESQTSFPWLDLSFWLLLWAALFLVLEYLSASRRLAQGSVLLLAALLPLLYGRTSAAAARLPRLASPYAATLVDDQPELFSQSHSLDQEIIDQSAKQPDGQMLARAPEQRFGLLSFARLPILRPGFHQIVLPDLQVEVPAGQIAGHLILSQRYITPAVSRWEQRLSLPLTDEEAQAGLAFVVDRLSIGYLYAEFSGTGELSFGQVQYLFYPVHSRVHLEGVARFPGAAGAGKELLAAQHAVLEPGTYQVHFALKGSTFSTFFARQPQGVAMAVYTAAEGSALGRETLAALGQLWSTQDRETFFTVGNPHYCRPQSESIQPPWWLAVPWVGASYFTLDFSLKESSDVLFLLRYPGEAELHLKEIILYRKRWDLLPAEAET